MVPAWWDDTRGIGVRPTGDGGAHHVRVFPAHVLYKQQGQGLGEVVFRSV